MEYIDLRSDTVSQMTDNMKQALVNAKVGDDVFMDDETTIELQNLAAEMTGKEAGLFVPTGSFGNQLSIISQTNRGEEMIVSNESHILVYESGAPAFIGNVQLRCVSSDKGIMNIEELKKCIRPKEGFYLPKTSLICLENALSNGCVAPLDYMEKVWKIAKEKEIPVHLDGARLFNAAVALGCDPKDITKYCDTLTFCLSKGLCCPLGSVVCGSKEFIKKAHFNRKMLGGGMRQTGYFAAAAIVALKEIVPQLKDDHSMARKLAEELQKFPNVRVINPEGKINMVFYQFTDKDTKSDDFKKFMLKKKIKILAEDDEQRIFRFVTHHWIREKEVDLVISGMKEYFQTH